MIYRCVYNGGWIKACYGDEAFELVKMNPVSCSGVSMGSRSAILVYVSVPLNHCLLDDSRAAWHASFFASLYLIPLYLPYYLLILVLI